MEGFTIVDGVVLVIVAISALLANLLTTGQVQCWGDSTELKLGQDYGGVARPLPVKVPVAAVAASFLEAVCDVLVRKALDAASEEGIDDLLIGGGVAANSRLRAMAEERAARLGIRVRVPRPGLCTDNGAMIAALGSELVARGRAPSALDLPADSSQPITTVVA